jgi:hypothetical protein
MHSEVIIGWEKLLYDIAAYFFIFFFDSVNYAQVSNGGVVTILVMFTFIPLFLVA